MAGRKKTGKIRGKGASKGGIKQIFDNIYRHSFVALSVYISLALLFISAVFVVGFVFFISRDLPSYEDLKDFKSRLTTRIYSADGVLLNDYAIENRVFIPIAEVPQELKNAFLSAEDARFYEHGGIDIMGIMKAAYKNALYFATKQGQIVGASTITQQVVKNVLLTNERTLSRKIKEMILAVEISKHLSKDEVLEVYLNQIYLGSGAYGVVTAATEYFGKPLKDLDIDEMALLAALPKAPSDINPRRRPERALERRNWVLGRMYDNGFLTREELSRYTAKPISVVAQAKSVIKNNMGANGFSDYVKSVVSAKYGSDAFFSEGYYIRTTLDYKLQTALFEAFRKGMLEYDKMAGYRGNAGKINVSGNWCEALGDFISKAEFQDYFLKYGVVLDFKPAESAVVVGTEGCASVKVPYRTFAWAGARPEQLVAKGAVIVYEYDEVNELYSFSQMPEANGGAMVVSPHNGDVLAMVGDFYDRANSFNRAISAKRQPGSLSKPFVYVMGLENGLAPNSILVDEELKLSDEWQPNNASRNFLGSVTLRTALERSRNVPTVRIAEMFGARKLSETIERFKLEADPLPQDLTLALGSYNSTVERMALGFSAFANGGFLPEARYIDKIQKSDGAVIYRKDPQCEECGDPSVLPVLKQGESAEMERVMAEDVAFQVLSILEGSVIRGTSYKLAGVAREGLAGKTGSSNDHKDAWYAGLTNDLSTVIYIGNDKPKTLGENMYGATVALPIFRDFITAAIKLYPLSEFYPPHSIERIYVDYNTGTMPDANTKRKIIENFKKGDKRPQNLFSARVKEKSDGEDVSYTGVY